MKTKGGAAIVPHTGNVAQRCMQAYFAQRPVAFILAAGLIIAGEFS
ncbi:MAG: hypothetical protein JSR65_10140 [Proteobacteria bacterium]|nr:hypothetical protein [Pseudomonadota bacterium]